MSSQDAAVGAPHKLGSAEVRFLTFLKITVGIFIVVILLWGEDEAYPLTRWPMFSEAGNGIPSQMSQLQVRLIDRSDRVRPVPRFYTFPFSAIQGRIVSRAFDTADRAEQDQYRIDLIERIRAAQPNLDPVQVQFRQLRWDVQADAEPPLDRDHPQIRQAVNFSTTYYADLAAPLAAPDADPDLRFGDQLALLAFEVPDGVETRQCEPLYIRSWWLTTEAPDKNYHITLTLADSAGMGVAQSDAPLGDLETVQLRAGDEIFDRRVIDVPCDLAPGEYSLLVGLYDLETMETVPLAYPDGNAYAGQLFYLTTIHVNEARPWR
jgi:hypothetical protein